MFFQYLFVGPARGPVELRDEGLLVFDADLIHPIFVTVQCEQASIGAKSDGIDRVQNQVGRQSGVGLCLFVHAATIRELR